MEEIINKELKKLEKGCGRSEEYWGHICGSWITNTSGKNVHIFCNRCVGKFEILKKLKRLSKS